MKEGMKERMDMKECIIKNLEDAGCNETKIRAFMAEMEYGKMSLLLNLLSEHRRELLDSLHKNQKQIDCLDYLIHQLKEKGNT